MQIGMLDHLQKWVFHCRKTREPLDKYNEIWLSVLAYHDLTTKNKSFEDVSHWNWQEMKQMNRYLLGVVTQSLLGGSPAQRLIFNCPIECTWTLLEFYMYARYKSHDDETLSYMEDALHRFHTFKDDSFLGRAGKKAKAKANDFRTEIVNKRKVDDETNAGSATPSTKWREKNALRYYISQEIDIFNELDADISIPKIHVMAYWAEQIRQSGALQLYSAQRHNQVHKTNVKDSRNTSNYNLTYLPQVITFQCHIL
jgi:hypothetical protein